jgi:hypothetical protein
VAYYYLPSPKRFLLVEVDVWVAYASTPGVIFGSFKFVVFHDIDKATSKQCASPIHRRSLLLRRRQTDVAMAVKVLRRGQTGTIAPTCSSSSPNFGRTCHPLKLGSHTTAIALVDVHATEGGVWVAYAATPGVIFGGFKFFVFHDIDKATSKPYASPIHRRALLLRRR